MIRQDTRRPATERGGILIHVAIALLALVGFSALTIDYGIMMLSRNQAQNAADAAAHAAAVSLAFDSPTDWDRARAAAETMGESHDIFGGAPDIVRGSGFSTNETLDISFPPVPSPACPRPGPDDTCVRVNVYRTTAAYNAAGTGDRLPLPTFFSRIWGRQNQGIRATASAQILSGNASSCLRPWAVADRWQENVKWQCNQQNQSPPNCQGQWVNNQNQTGNNWTRNDAFEKWNRNSNPPVVDPTIGASGNIPDAYVPYQNEANPGTGFALYSRDANGELVPKDYGTPLTMKQGCGESMISSGWYLKTDLSQWCTDPGCPSNQGADMYRFSIGNCIGGVRGIGDTIPVATGCTSGPTGQGVYDSVGQGPPALVELDPEATWNETTKTIENSCAPGICPPPHIAPGGTYRSFSPRIVPIALFNIDQYLANGYTGSNGQVTITNIMGFFIVTRAQAQAMGLRQSQGGGQGGGNSQDEVYGVMVAVPGLTQNNTNNTSSFVTQIVLTR